MKFRQSSVYKNLLDSSRLPAPEPISFIWINRLLVALLVATALLAGYFHSLLKAQYPLPGTINPLAVEQSQY